MSDESLDKSWIEITDDIAVGARLYSAAWPQWFAETSGTFEERIRKVFDERGHMPSPRQFYRLQDDLRAKRNEMEGPPKSESKKKTTRKGKSDDDS